MPMPVMDIRHVIVLVLLGGMLMLVRMDSIHHIVRVSGIVVPVAVIME